MEPAQENFVRSFDVVGDAEGGEIYAVGDDFAVLVGEGDFGDLGLELDC